MGEGRSPDRPCVAVIGGGPAGLMAAAVLARYVHVDLYERNRHVGRKFLVAGAGGLNITNQAEGEELLQHYAPAERLAPLLQAFTPGDLRAWLSDLGVETFTGTSGRVFPVRGTKPAQVLRILRRHAEDRGVRILTGQVFSGFTDDARPMVEQGGTAHVLEHEQVLFALGGASWSRTGSKGDWLEAFEAIGVRTLPFQSSNCGVELDLPGSLAVHAGRPLKNIALRAGLHEVRGEATITAHGIEGNAVYPLVPVLRKQLLAGEEATLHLDLKPDLALPELEGRLRDAVGAERRNAAGLDRPSWALLKAFTGKEVMDDPGSLALAMKGLRLPVQALRPIDEAISTVGGIAMDQVNEDLSLKAHPHLHLAGEMLDWDAPTGGFLLQGAFATGRWAAQGILKALGKGS